MQHEVQQSMQHDVTNGLRGVLPVLPIPIEHMSEANRIAFEAHVQAEKAKHQAAKEAAEAEAQANARAEAEKQRSAQAQVVPQALPLDFKTMQKRAEQANAMRVMQEQQDALVLEIANKILVGIDDKHFIGRYGSNLVLRAQEQSKSMKPTTQQAFTRARNRTNEAHRELGRALAANGAGHQHSVEDYTNVLLTQLNLLSQGSNPTANAVLNMAYPDNPAKAKSIGNSRRMSRVRKAYEQEQVKNHPVQVQIAMIYSDRELQHRLSSSCFRHSLAWNNSSFSKASRIAALEARVTVLELQARSAKCREALADAGATSSKAKVIALYQSGLTSKPISEALGMSYETVKSIIKRYKDAQERPVQGAG